MGLTLDLSSGQCPYCGSVNLLPGFYEMKVYTCRQGGELVCREDGPDVECIFCPQDR